MGLFGRDRKQPSSRLLNASAVDLARIGFAAFGGDSPYPAGFQLAGLDHFALFALETANYPAPGTSAYQEVQNRFLGELVSTAEQSQPWGVIGAFCIATNFLTDEQRRAPTFLDLMDDALLTLRNDGVAYPALPPFALRRWEEVHGSEGPGPAEWPSALESLAVPAVGAEPPTVDLAKGESRRMTSDGPGGDARVTYAQWSTDGQVVAIIDGVDLSDGLRKRWGLGVRADSYTSFLRELGDRLVSCPWWAHEDLQPYFPCRQRSRNDMRKAAQVFR